MKIAFLTEMGFEGKIPSDHPNMRTEFAWMHALDADHYSIYSELSRGKVANYDKVFIIFPKGQVYLNAVGSRISNDKNSVSGLLETDLVSILRSQGNTQIYYVQEGPHWLWNDYEIVDQVRFYNFVSSCDGVYAHNESDTKYYKGMFPHLSVRVLPTLMIETLLQDITPQLEEKTIIGGNFVRWYGGFESYIVASEFGCMMWTQNSHATRENENLMEGLHHLPRLQWIDWMRELSTFKYAVHLMPTVAAGTFSLNCAYFGIPTIGNINVDTQRLCHPELSVDIYDVDAAKKLSHKLKNDTEYYQYCSATAKQNYLKYFSIDNFKKVLSI